MVNASVEPSKSNLDTEKVDLPLDLLERAMKLEKFAVSKLITMFEDRRSSAAAMRSAILEWFDAQRPHHTSTIIGITGTPGSGKSTLLSRVTVDLLEQQDRLTIAVVAVDPSSHVSGGALLGDRTRMRYVADERRLFFRSQASANDLGGLGPMSFQVCRLLTRLFDCVMIETVGIGQSEADIRHLADRIYLVIQPLGGDEVQFLKAGIIEIPQAFIINKSDEPSAEQSYHQLRSSMWLARPFDEQPPPIFRTSARTGAGLSELEDDLLNTIVTTQSSSLREREPYFFERWVEDEWGRVGLDHLHTDFGGPSKFVATHGGFDRSQVAFDAAIRSVL